MGAKVEGFQSQSLCVVSEGENDLSAHPCKRLCHIQHGSCCCGSNQGKKTKLGRLISAGLPDAIVGFLKSDKFCHNMMAEVGWGEG